MQWLNYSIVRKVQTLSWNVNLQWCISFIFPLKSHQIPKYYNTISLSRHEQVCLMRLRFERYFSHHWEKYLSKRSLIKHTCS